MEQPTSSPNKNPSTDFASRVASHWTKEREAKVTGGKHWLIKPSEAADLLRVLGLLNADASMPADAVRKFSQINHMLMLLKPILDDLKERHTTVRIVDAACGTSFLTLLLGWYFKNKLNSSCRIVGIDSNAKLITTSRDRAAKLGLQDFVRFSAGSIADIAWDDAFAALYPEDEIGRPHLLVSLHACDTASDQALAFGIQHKVDAMAVAPCCHAELAKKWKDLSGVDEHPFSPIFKTANLRRETAAHITDTMRLLLSRSRGYEVTATEFVPSAHTPKNRMLLCQRRGQYLLSAGVEYARLTESLAGQGILLADLVAHGDKPVLDA